MRHALLRRTHAGILVVFHDFPLPVVNSYVDDLRTGCFALLGKSVGVSLAFA
jgi:hypothetical protein